MKLPKLVESLLFVILFCSLLGCTTALIDHLDAQLRPFAQVSYLHQLFQKSPSSAHFPPPQAVFDSPTIRKTIIDVIQTASPKSALYLTTYVMTDATIKEVLVDAHKRGAETQIIADGAYAYGEHSQIPGLIKAGIPVYLYQSPTFNDPEILAKMHNKIIVKEDPEGTSVAITGSYNLTNSAAKYNEENIVLLYHPEIIKKYKNHVYTLREKSIRAKITKFKKTPRNKSF
jgi:phosphatidylserine/phosphatidylglycerophosphate/cardiolipin synthase-like enzyme